MNDLIADAADNITVDRIIASIQQAATQRPSGHDRRMPLFDQKNPPPTGETAASAPTMYAATQKLWEHQERSLAELRLHIGRGKRRLMLMLATGGGKTRLIAEIVHGALGKGKTVAIVVSRIDYDALIVVATTQELIDADPQILSRFKVFAPSEPDLANVRTVRGDYAEDDVADVMDRPAIAGDIVATWFSLGENARPQQRAAPSSCRKSAAVCAGTKGKSTVGFSTTPGITTAWVG